MKIRKQYDQLEPSDFEQYPIWEHALDEEGVEGQDELTVRPKTDLKVPEPGWGDLIVGVEFTANDSTVYHGLCTLDCGRVIQVTWPKIRTDSGPCCFYLGKCTPEQAVEQVKKQYQLLNKTAESLFPIRYRLLVPVESSTLKQEDVISGFSYTTETRFLKRERIREIR